MLRSGADRADYLLIKETKIIAMTCTHAALKRRDLVQVGFKVKKFLYHLFLKDLLIHSLTYALKTYKLPLINFDVQSWKVELGSQGQIPASSLVFTF